MTFERPGFRPISILSYVSWVPVLMWGLFEVKLKSLIGNDIWNVCAVFLSLFIVAGIAIPLIGSFRGVSKVVAECNFFWGEGGRAAKILALGKRATATVIDIIESNLGGTTTINDQPYLNLRLQIDDGQTKPYETSLDTVIPRAALAQFQPGARFTVRVDPENPNAVVFVEQNSTPPQYLQENPLESPPVYGEAPSGGTGEGDEEGWSERDNKLLEQQGKDGMAKVLSVEDTGRAKNSRPVVKIHYEVFIPHEEPYRVTREVSLPADLVQQLKESTGRSFACRVHPDNPQKIMVKVIPYE